jgi:hypothetical protein
MREVPFKFDPSAPPTLVPTEPVAQPANPAVELGNQPVPPADPTPAPAPTPAPVAPVDPAPAPVDPVVPPSPAPVDPAPVEPTPMPSEEQILTALRAKYGDKVTDLDSVFNPKPADPIKPITKVPEVTDEETAKFLRYQSETGRPLKDWIALNQDLKQIDPITLAKNRIIAENQGVELTPEEVNFLLEDKLGFDPNDADLDPKEKALFKQFYGAQLKTMQDEQAKYNNPIEGYTPNSQSNPQPETGGKVTLSNGIEVDEESYNRDRQAYLQARSLQVESLTEEKISVSVDGKDGKKDLALSYQFTPEDRRGMLAETEDLGSILERFVDPQTKQLDHKELNLRLWRGKKENFDKILSVMATQIRSEVIAEVTGNRRNLQLDQPNTPPAPLPNQGYAQIGQTPAGAKQGTGVKFPWQTTPTTN